MTGGWIILMIDRTRLGYAVFAVAPDRERDRPSKIRRTMSVGNARRFPTRRRAALAAKQLGKLDRLHMFVPARVEPGDFERRRDVPSEVQAELFDEEGGGE